MEPPPNTLAADLPGMIKDKRERVGWHQGQLAEYLGCSRATVNRYESGHEYPKAPELIRAVAVFLRMPAGVIFEGVPSNVPPPPPPPRARPRKAVKKR